MPSASAPPPPTPQARLGPSSTHAPGRHGLCAPQRRCAPPPPPPPAPAGLPAPRPAPPHPPHRPRHRADWPGHRPIRHWPGAWHRSIPPACPQAARTAKTQAVSSKVSVPWVITTAATCGSASCCPHAWAKASQSPSPMSLLSSWRTCWGRTTQPVGTAMPPEQVLRRNLPRLVAHAAGTAGTGNRAPHAQQGQGVGNGAGARPVFCLMAACIPKQTG